jgi:hypothetical protein
MKRLHTRVNLIPIIAKADTLTHAEIAAFKSRILEDIAHHGIQIFRPTVSEVDDGETVAEVKEIMVRPYLRARVHIDLPFAQKRPTGRAHGRNAFRLQWWEVRARLK